MVVNGLLIQAGNPSLNYVRYHTGGGAAGLAYMIVFSQWLLPNRRLAIRLMDNPREHTVEMLVDGASSLVGQTIEQAGLRHLQGLHLVGIDRGDQVLAAVSPLERLQANDRLIFVGIVESVVDLHKDTWIDTRNRSDLQARSAEDKTLSH